MFSRSVSRLPSAFLTGRRTLQSPLHSIMQTRFNSSSSSGDNSSYKEGMSRYKLFSGPFAKVFLGAVFTYQVIYWTWLKLEMDESKFEKNKEVAALESKARELTASQK